ncbi:MAG TPA: DUF1837 domain-containing protein [Pyrinomonadaceae bacterium]|jgi:hypothetical protein|nr:DUF1837 domain-containing protein [Pyrinomonadaceae bacterium]
MIPFEVLIDDLFDDVCPGSGLTPIENKNVLSMLNDFEDQSWRYKRFHNFIWDNIAETALSAKERANLSAKRLTALTEAAKNLRLIDGKTSATEGSELAEIVLYGIMRGHYGALPVVPKIFYKQNANDFAKGSDSVHIVREGDSDFSIWFGEAKFYNEIQDARLDAVVTSVENSLALEKLKKENGIITGVSDLNNLGLPAQLVENIEQVLNSDTSIDAIKPKLHVPILLLHECSITAAHKQMSAAYRDEISTFHKDRATAYFRKQIKKLGTKVHLYSEITFHILLLPVPSKQKVTSRFLAFAKELRG